MLHHRLALESEISINALAAEKFIVPRPSSVWRLVIDALFEKVDLKLDISFETTNRETVHRFVAAGLGVALLPVSHFMDDLRSKDVVYIPLSEDRVYGEIGAVWLGDRAQTTIAARFLEFLLSAMDAAASSGKGWASGLYGLEHRNPSLRKHGNDKIK